MPFKPQHSHETKWLATLGQIRWEADSYQGELLALSEKFLQISCQDAKFHSLKSASIKIHYGNSDFYLSGTLQGPTDNEGLLFAVMEKDLSKIQDLLNSLRKSQHLRICQNENVEASDHFTGFSSVSFIPEAIADLNWEDISLKRSFLGHQFSAPILITGMTGGIEQGQQINYRLAKAAAHHKIPMGIGSQRMALENPAYRPIFTVKDHVPDLFLIANLGGGQLCGPDALKLCREAVDMVGADALAIHLNIIQECIQVEGRPSFRGLLEKIAEICTELKVPVIVKEVGSGISPHTADKLLKAGVAAIDCGGRGGTSWGYIEGLRSKSEQTMDLARSYRDWGIPTAFSLAAIHKKIPQMPLIATGGIRDGLTVAKAIALGAQMVGLGLPLLRAASQSEEKVKEVLNTMIKGLHIAMFATGCARLEQLKDKIVFGHPYEFPSRF